MPRDFHDTLLPPELDLYRIAEDSTGGDEITLHDSFNLLSYV